MKTCFRKLKAKLLVEVKQGAPVPKWYGFCFAIAWKGVAYFAPVPLNWPIALGYRLYAKVATAGWLQELPALLKCSDCYDSGWRVGYEKGKSEAESSSVKRNP